VNDGAIFQLFQPIQATKTHDQSSSQKDLTPNVMAASAQEEGVVISGTVDIS